METTHIGLPITSAYAMTSLTVATASNTVFPEVPQCSLVWIMPGINGFNLSTVIHA